MHVEKRIRDGYCKRKIKKFNKNSNQEIFDSKTQKQNSKATKSTKIEDSEVLVDSNYQRDETLNQKSTKRIKNKYYYDFDKKSKQKN